MDVSSVSSSSYTASTSSSSAASSANNKAAENQTKENQANEAAATETPAAVYEKSSNKTAYKPDTETMNKIKSQTALKNQQLQDLVTKLLSSQKDASFKYTDLLSKSNIQAAIDGGKVDQATIDQAKQDISEDGYFGVKQTTERIMSFAKAISGGDPSKIDELREAVEKGFKLAEQMWGDKLPDISQKTYDAVMNEFDKWKESATGAIA